MTIDGRRYPVVNWNSSAFILTSWTGDCKSGDDLDIEFSAMLADRPLTFVCKGFVIRVDGPRQEIAIGFGSMGKVARAMINKHFEAA